MKQIILTGGSGGIGRAIAIQLSRAGYAILNLDVQEPEQLVANEKYIAIDFASQAETEKIAATISLAHNLYGIIHCAGFGGPYQKTTEVSLQTYNRIMNTNLFSAFFLLQKYIPLMAENKFGRVIFISSILGKRGSANSSVYSASKHALNGLMKSVADEWGPHGITANSISPGFVATKMGIQEDQVDGHMQKVIQNTPVRRIAAPEEIASIVMFLLSEHSGYINGADWVADGGITNKY